MPREEVGDGGKGGARSEGDAVAEAGAHLAWKLVSREEVLGSS